MSGKGPGRCRTVPNNPAWKALLQVQRVFNVSYWDGYWFWGFDLSFSGVANWCVCLCIPSTVLKMLDTWNWMPVIRYCAHMSVYLYSVYHVWLVVVHRHYGKGCVGPELAPTGPILALPTVYSRDFRSVTLPCFPNMSGEVSNTLPTDLTGCFCVFVDWGVSARGFCLKAGGSKR